MELSTPFVRIDLDRMENNIRLMIERLKKVGITHRPHIKAHKSIAIAKKQIELGASGITTAKLSEAEVMVDGGIEDILIAFPILGEEKLLRLEKLARRANIKATIDSRAIAEGISRVGERLGRRIDVLIELDGGIHRCGVQPGEQTLKFAKSIEDLDGINVIGLMTYMGQIQAEKTKEGMKSIAKSEVEMFKSTQRLLNANGFNITVLSGGSSAASVFEDQLAGITESRAGNYIFSDMNAVHLGISTEKDIALKVCSTVVSTPLPGYATIDAGSKTLTSDASRSGSGYGRISGMADVEIVKLSEEHGFIRFDPANYNLKVGDVVEIMPNHCCVVPNLCDCVYGFRGRHFDGMIRIDARGKNY